MQKKKGIHRIALTRNERQNRGNTLVYRSQVTNTQRRASARLKYFFGLMQKPCTFDDEKGQPRGNLTRYTRASTLSSSFFFIFSSFPLGLASQYLFFFLSFFLSCIGEWVLIVFRGCFFFYFEFWVGM